MEGLRFFWRSFCYLLSYGLLGFLTACSPNLSQGMPPPPNPITLATPSPAVSSELLKSVVMGQTIYVPVYSHIYYNNQNSVLNLAVTLSIRNTDLQQPLFIKSVRYYDTEGNLVKVYLDQIQRLGPLASTSFVVERQDTRGGSGANFIVEWISPTVMTEPIVEAIAIGTDSNQGISFTSTGKVIQDDRSSSGNLEEKGKSPTKIQSPAVLSPPVPGRDV